jgi:hypothetical protein
MTVTPSVFTVNECGRIDDGRLEWATDTNVEHVINDMVGRVCTRAHMRLCSCLLENGRRCTRPACSHSFSKRIEKSVSQRRVDVRVDPSAKHTNICVTHRRQLVPPTATGVTSIHASSTADKVSLGTFVIAKCDVATSYERSARRCTGEHDCTRQER